MDSDKIRFFFPKLKNRILIERKRLWKYCDTERMAMRGFKPFVDALSFKSSMQSMFGIFSADILVGISDNDRCFILETANQALMHDFDLLGSGSVTINPIDWHTDFKSGARWEKKWYREISYINDADIKVPWELSRCQHLLWLGEAFLLTGEDKYAQEIIDEIKWWIDDNPLMYSVNWTCAMDVSFRAVNWMYALNMISAYSGFDDLFSKKVTESLWQHGFFVWNNLERLIPYSNNHYASDIVGLLYLGVLFSYTPKGRKWMNFAITEYYSEVRKQILPSGVHYERSVSYHRLMTELLSYGYYVLERTGKKVPMDVKERIAKMYGYVACYTKPNGLAPLIADNDDGRFVPFIKRDFRQHGYLNVSTSVENRFAALGQIPLSLMAKTGEQLFDDANVAIVRKGDSFLFVNGGGFSKIPRDGQMLMETHTHNDFLSFELCMEGMDLLVDAGTYLYTSSKTDRNAFRSTYKHNTLVVDGEEQNELAASFSLRRNLKEKRLKREKENTYCGEYRTLKGNLLHKRSFSLKERECTIVDMLAKEGKGHKAEFFFHFAEGIQPKLKNGIIWLNDNVSISFSVKPQGIDIIEDTLSPSFGVLTVSKTAVVTYSFDENLSIITNIVYKNGQE